MKTFFLFLGLIFFQYNLSAQKEVQAADKLMSAAFQKASNQNKNVILIFHASWCGWCKRMDKLMNNDSCKGYFERNYVITHLDVDETEAEKNLENPGADAVRIKYGASKDDGLPVWFILDKKGNVLDDSKYKTNIGKSKAGDNIGCPNSEQEVTYFIALLKKTSKLSATDETIIRSLFQEKK